MAATNVAIDDALIALLSPTGEDIPGAVREALTLELYLRGDISAGRAAIMLGMPKREFIRWSGEQGIPYVRYGTEELAGELRALRSLTT